MTLYDFHRLKEYEQFNTVWEQGTFLRNRIDGNTAYSLYALSNFWVELCYHVDENKIASLRAFTKSEQVEPYLEDFQLPT